MEHRADTSRPPPDDKPAYAKGGEWREGDSLILPELRDSFLAPDLTSQGHGFRCAADPP
ncbi:MAG: hypothetical protein H6746_01640 [Deltaproteobacteria bacterium]|nr:hypothetical protein [Deltaproteobacteria bacterium]